MFKKFTEAAIKVNTIIFIIIIQRLLKILSIIPLTFIYQVYLKWIQFVKRIRFNHIIISYIN